MYVSYPEAAQAKMCSTHLVRSAVSAKSLRGDDVFVVWDQAFEDWMPDMPVQRIVQALNERRYDSRSMVLAVSSKPVPEIQERARRQRNTLGGYDEFVIPVNKHNVELLLRSQDGYHDSQPYHERAVAEFWEALESGRRVYQIRVGMRPSQYGGKHLYSSLLSTPVAIAGHLGVDGQEVMDAVLASELTHAPYRGEIVVIKDKEYERWAARMTGSEQLQQEELAGGTPPDGGFWQPELELQAISQ